MQSLEDEEAPGLPCSAGLDVAPSVPSQPFPFLKLPREIRDLIYHYAPLRGPTVTPIAISYMLWILSLTVYWGTEKSTRLFRTNRQVSTESSEMFYSSFPFHFPQTVDIALVNATL